MQGLIWITFFLPLIAAVVIALFTRDRRELSARLSIGSIVVAFVCAALYSVLTKMQGGPAAEPAWLEIAGTAPGDILSVGFGLLLDPLSLTMLLVVTGVGMMIQIYSRGYMKDDPGYSRYFACLSFFTFSMMGIVLATNFVQMFIFWELVGVSSYLLIGFWFGKPAAADAGKKAFITNRLGDFGFLLGILILWSAFGEVNFAILKSDFADGGKALAALGGFGFLSMTTVAGLLIFCGAVGKSAQFPLHVWLPDAMEGPTPVSALIHAATMVAAGVYMLCRVIFIFDATALFVIACVGGFTSLIAALMAVRQDDIKRILAYSTLSQLGFMVMAVGMSHPGTGDGATAAMFHLSTHAAFKALLFLGAGSVICALHHEQDIWKMGGLRDRMPTTYWTFCAGTLALMGCPFTSGFYSKDAILLLADPSKGGHVLFFIVGVMVAFLTPFYMTRLVLVAFHGSARTEEARHAKESPWVMTGPLWVLGFFAVFAGWMGIDAILAPFFGSEVHYHSLGGAIIAPLKEPVAGLAGTGIALLGAYFSWSIYNKAESDPLPKLLGPFQVAARWARDRFYFDQIYKHTFVAIHDAIASVADWFDRWIISGLLVRGTHGTTELVGRVLRMLQTGNLQTYAFLSIFAAAVLLILIIFRG